MWFYTEGLKSPSVVSKSLKLYFLEPEDSSQKLERLKKKKFLDLLKIEAASVIVAFKNDEYVVRRIKTDLGA